MAVSLPEEIWAKIYGYLRDTVWKVNDIYYSVLSISRASLNVTGMTFPLTSDFRCGMSAGWLKERPPIDWKGFTYEEYKNYPTNFNWSNHANPWHIMRTSIWDPEKERRREEANKTLVKWCNRKRTRPNQ